MQVTFKNMDEKLKQECITVLKDTVKKHYSHLGPPPLTIEVKSIGKASGLYRPYFYHIFLNKRIIGEYGTPVILRTLRHELAHYICDLLYKDIMYPHDYNFMKICSLFGGSANSLIREAATQYNIEIPVETQWVTIKRREYKYEYICPTCRNSFKYKRKLKINNRICRKCGTSVSKFLEVPL